MSTITIQDTYQQVRFARAVACIALAVTVIILCALPLTPVSVLVASVPTVVIALMAQRANARVERSMMELVRRRWTKVRPDQIPGTPTAIYIGEGARWVETDDGKKYRSAYKAIISKSPTFPVQQFRKIMTMMKLWPAARDADHSLEDTAMNIALAEGGDPRLMGILHEDLHSIFVSPTILSQHMFIFGASGQGKTRFVELLIVWAIRNNRPLMFIDPKGDEAIADLMYHCAKLAGVPFVHFDMVNTARSACYNPFADWQQPADLLQKATALIKENTSQPFWSDQPRGSAGGVLVEQGWNKMLLEALGASEDIVSPMHQALAHAVAAAAAAGRAVTVADIEAGWEDARRAPLRAEYGDPVYSLCPDGSVPTLETLYNMVVDRCRVVLAWSIKLVHPELMVGIDPVKLYEYEAAETDRRQSEAPQGEEVPAFKIRLPPLLVAKIPLEDPDWAANQPEPASGTKLAPEVVEALWEPLREQAPQIIKALTSLRAIAENQAIPWMELEATERKRYASALQAACSAYIDRYELVRAPRPELSVSRIIKNRGVAFVQLSSMAVGGPVEAIGKMLIADVSAWAGRVNAGSEKKVPMFLLCDEMAAFLTTEYVRLGQQCRSAGVSLTGLAQSVPGLAASLHDQQAVRDLLNNVRTRVQLKTTDKEERNAAADLFGEVVVSEFSRNVSVGPSVGSAGNELNNTYTTNLGVSEQEKEMTLVPAGVFKDLPAGAAVLSTGDGPIFVQTPLIVLPPDQMRWSEIQSKMLPMEPWHVASYAAANIPLPKWHQIAVDKRNKDAANSGKEAA